MDKESGTGTFWRRYDPLLAPIYIVAPRSEHSHAFETRQRSLVAPDWWFQEDLASPNSALPNVSSDNLVDILRDMRQENIQ